MTSNIQFYTSYHQFYINDKSNEFDINSSFFWTKKALKERLALDNEIIGISTGSYGEIKLEISFLNEANKNINFDLYDHIVEGSIEIKSGVIQVLDCPSTNTEFERKIKCGIYRIRVYSSNLDIEDEDNCKDYYKLEIWEDEYSNRKVLKQYKHNSSKLKLK